MKILILVDGLPAGGVERQIVELLKGLRGQSDIETLVCSLSAGGAREAEAGEYADHWLDSGGAANAGLSLLFKYPLLVIRVLKAIRGRNISLVHTYGCFSDTLGVIISKWFGIPFINGSIRAARPRLNYRDRVTRFCLSFATKVISNSHAGLESYGITGNGFVIHNGVDLKRFSDVVPAPLSGAPVLCMVGNFTVKKDQGSVIRCLPELKKEFPEIKLLLIGRGKTLSANKALAAQLGCDKHIVFIENCDSPESFIASSNVCLLMSNNAVHGEGISNAIMEYMAMGKPVIASNSGGNSELVNGGKTGYLVENNRQAEAIRTLLNNPLLGQQMGEAGRRRISEEFTIDKMIRAYVALYESVTENR